MESTLLAEQAPHEFFRVQVARAMEHQKLEMSAFVQQYVVDLLGRRVRSEPPLPLGPGQDEMPLALLYLHALQAASHERARRLREMGDTALFLSGFFGDALVERVGDLRYYRRLGGDAYARLGRERTWIGADVFSELARRFHEIADVLSEVSEASRLTDSRSVLKLYARWTQTGSPRSARLLAERGITPVAPVEGRVH